MDPIESHFYGSATRRLCGLSCVPDGRFRSHSVGLCPPGPSRCRRSNLALQRVVSAGSRRGSRLGPFGYDASGDSDGAAEPGSLSGCTANIVAAADDLCERSRASGGPQRCGGPAAPGAPTRRGIMRSLVSVPGVTAPLAVELPTRTTAERHLSRPSAPERSNSGCC
jgi:hypothetical protein